MPDRIIKIFLSSAAGLILAAAVERFVCQFHGTLTSRMMLSVQDSFFGFQVRDEIWAFAIVELIIAGCLMFMGDVVNRLMLLAWAMTNYFVLKYVIVSCGIIIQTSFIGSLSDPFHLAHGWPGKVVSIISFYLLVGAYLALGWLWLRQTKRERTTRVAVQTGRDGFWKMSCPACGGHVKFALQNAGQKIPCPHCEKTLTLRREENLKMSCFFCAGHIEFPGHALGQKISCPHCLKDITLKDS